MEANSNSDKSNKLLNRKFNLWSPGFLIAGFVFYSGAMFVRTALDEIVVFVVAILAGVLYSRTKKRINFIGNNIIKGIIAATGLVVVSAILIGFVTRIV